MIPAVLNQVPPSHVFAQRALSEHTQSTIKAIALAMVFFAVLVVRSLLYSALIMPVTLLGVGLCFVCALRVLAAAARASQPSFRSGVIYTSSRPSHAPTPHVSVGGGHMPPRRPSHAPGPYVPVGGGHIR